MKRHGRKPMIQRAMTLACVNLCALSNRAQDEGARQTHGIAQAMPHCQMCGDGRRQRAARAVHVTTGNALRRQTLRTAVGLYQQIDHFVTHQVPAFEQHRLDPHGQQILLSLIHI